MDVRAGASLNACFAIQHSVDRKREWLEAFTKMLAENFDEANKSSGILGGLAVLDGMILTVSMAAAGNYIGDYGFEALAKMLAVNQSLVHLDLSSECMH